MPCNPNDNNLNPSPGTNLPIPGFPTLPFAPIQIDNPFDFAKLIPNGFPQKLLELIDSLTIKWSGGDISPNLDNLSNTVLKALASIFNEIAPFLNLYNFIQPLFNLILCIIEILCAILKPLKMKRAVKRLIKRCLPDFLRLFPFLALLAMIISLLLLLLALIEYIIEQILKLIKDLLENLAILTRSVTIADEQSIIAVANKIASLLCILENLFSVFAALAAIFAIIETLSKLGGRSICGKSKKSGDDVDCCDDDDCPPFISDNPNGITSFGQIAYNNEYVKNDFSGFERPEKIQMYSTQVNIYNIADIITENSIGEIFWSEGKVYKSNSNLTKVPYTADIIIYNFNPVVFHPTDTDGARSFIIKDAIFAEQPYIGVYNQLGELTEDTIYQSGTVKLVGGKVYEYTGTDGYKDFDAIGEPYIIDGNQATINTFIHKDPSTSASPPVINDTIYINASYNWKFNYDQLFADALITLACDPEVRFELDVLNNTNPGIQESAEDKVRRASGDPNKSAVPNLGNVQNCLSNALIKLRKDINENSVLEFQAEAISCLEGLKGETLDLIKDLMTVSPDVVKSEISLDPDLQFTTRTIKADVIFKDSLGVQLFTTLPNEIKEDIEKLVKGQVSLGNVTNFIYDGYGKFTAAIISNEPGDGELSVSFNENMLQRILNLNDDDQPSIVEINTVPYTFIKRDLPIAELDDFNPAIRRDNTDIANAGVENG